MTIAMCLKKNYQTAATAVGKKKGAAKLRKKSHKDLGSFSSSPVGKFH